MDIVKRTGLLLIAFGYFLVFIPASSVRVPTNNCTVPPQPANGYRQLINFQCQSQQSNATMNNCDLQEGTKLPTWYILIYTCNSGYKTNGSNYVFCDQEGNWSDIPVCSEIRCEPLASASTNADCTLNGRQVSCESPVLPGTTAKLNCRENYQEIGNSQSKQVDQVKCNDKGQWEPQPLRCFPSTLPINILVKNDTLTVQIYIEKNNPFCQLLKIFRGKIIIQTDDCNGNYFPIDVR